MRSRIALLATLLAVVGLASDCDEPVKSTRIDPGSITFHNVRDGDVNLRCAWFEGSGEGSGSIFCYVVQR